MNSEETLSSLCQYMISATSALVVDLDIEHHCKYIYSLCVAEFLIDRRSLYVETVCKVES